MASSILYIKKGGSTAQIHATSLEHHSATHFIYTLWRSIIGYSIQSKMLCGIFFFD